MEITLSGMPMRQRLAGKRCSNLSSMFFIYADSWQAVVSCRMLPKAVESNIYTVDIHHNKFKM